MLGSMSWNPRVLRTRFPFECECPPAAVMSAGDLDETNMRKFFWYLERQRAPIPLWGDTPRVAPDSVRALRVRSNGPRNEVGGVRDHRWLGRFSRWSRYPGMGKRHNHLFASIDETMDRVLPALGKAKGPPALIAGGPFT